MQKQTQRQKIKSWLEQGNTLTPLEALEKFGCFRLATRIFELKREGLNIDTKIVENKATGKRYAEYRLIAAQAAQQTTETPPVTLATPQKPQPIDDELF